MKMRKSAVYFLLYYCNAEDYVQDNTQLKMSQQHNTWEGIRPTKWAFSGI